MLKVSNEGTTGLLPPVTYDIAAVEDVRIPITHMLRHNKQEMDHIILWPYFKSSYSKLLYSEWRRIYYMITIMIDG